MTTMFVKIAILLFAGCAVALARPQDASTLQQTQNQLQNQPQVSNPNQAHVLNNQLQGLNQNQLQALIAAQLQGLNPNQLQALLTGQLQGFNSNQIGQGYNPNQLLNMRPGLNNGYNYGYNGNYQTPILELPNHAIDWGQKFLDGSVSRVGAALGQAFENTERVANNAIDTVGQVGMRGFQDGSTLVKSGLGILTAFPKIGLDLLSRNNNNNGYGF